MVQYSIYQGIEYAIEDVDAFDPDNPFDPYDPDYEEKLNTLYFLRDLSALVWGFIDFFRYFPTG